VLWALLYDDAFAELKLLWLRTSGWDAPPGAGAGAELDFRIRELTQDPEGLPPDVKQEFAALLAGAGFAPYFDAARLDVVRHLSYASWIGGAMEPLTDYRVAFARAIVARCIQRYREDKDLPEGFLPLSGAVRDRIVELLVAALGGREAGVADWVKETASGLVKGAGTRWFKRRRGRLSDLFAPFGADIVVYQARPQAIREFIRDKVVKALAACNRALCSRSGAL
jgi:hypothetical protein